MKGKWSMLPGHSNGDDVYALFMGVVKEPTKCSTVGIQGIAWAFGGMIYALVYCTAGISGKLSVPILAPLPIGFAVFLVHLASIPITGTGINPARSLGAVIIFNKDKGWDDHVSQL
ncbi:hypothetical protein V6N12_019541 [Hibiscus sabdariffa]|uniref:Aquaporin n=1 Tax=Hibiscus sabdariffa TaxID=183260 RepID=A0ABR2BN26_9ROSI